MMSFNIEQKLITVTQRVIKNVLPSYRRISSSISKSEFVSEQPLTNTSADSQYFEDILKKLDYRKNIKIMLQPYNFIASVPCTHSMLLLTKSLNHWIKLPEDKLQAAMEINDSSFVVLTLLDDLGDDSRFRRGLPSAHRIYGHERIMYSAYAVMLMNVKRLITMNESKAATTYCDSMIRFAAGECKKARDKLHLSCPTVDEYIRDNVYRLGGWFNLVVGIMQDMSNCKLDFSRLINVHSILFQVQNDIGKNDRDVSDDISLGTYTFPIVLAAETKTEESEVILDILRQKTKDPDMIGLCIDLLKKLDAFEKGKAFEIQLRSRLEEEVNRLGGNPEFMEVIDKKITWQSDVTPKEIPWEFSHF